MGFRVHNAILMVLGLNRVPRAQSVTRNVSGFCRNTALPVPLRRLRDEEES